MQTLPMAGWAIGQHTENNPLLYSHTILPVILTAGNWDDTYVTLENYKFIEDQSAGPDKAYFFAIAKIMKVFHFQRLVDLYNNVPYTDALIATNSFPKFDDAGTIYKDLVLKLDSAVNIIKSANVLTVENPGAMM